MTDNAIVAEGVHKSFGGVRAVSGVDLGQHLGVGDRCRDASEGRS